MNTNARNRSRVTPFEGAASESVGKRYAWDSNINGFQSNPLQDKIYSHTRSILYGEYTQDELHSGPPYRTGGPFKNVKFTVLQPLGFQGFGTYISKPPGHPPWTWEKYVGGFSPPADTTMGGPVFNAATQLTEASTLFPGVSSSECERAWKMSKPKLEQANLFVSIAELRDLPRMLKSTAAAFKETWDRRRGSGRDALIGTADDFLNLEFGWKPFVSDIRKMIDLVSQAERFMEEISSRNGKPTRRKVTLFNTESNSKVSSGSGNLCLPSSLPTSYFLGTPSWEVHEIVTDSANASSKWTYYNPLFDAGAPGYKTTLSAIRRYLTLYGLRVTPANIYRATPWTWLIDWFTNLGQLVDAMSDGFVDETVCLYMYVTRTRKVERRFIQTLPFTSGTVNLVWSKFYETKERVSILSPYGFSLTWDMLSPRQLGILGALGLTGGKRPVGG